ncbi:MAG: hypothetical protein NT065_06630 [Chlamydiae bacterium]|nr:hypothetical protein [Chlamydiota bacterium]
MKIGDLHTLKIKADRAIGNQERGSSFQELMKKSARNKSEKKPVLPIESEEEHEASAWDPLAIDQEKEAELLEEDILDEDASKKNPIGAHAFIPTPINLYCNEADTKAYHNTQEIAAIFEKIGAEMILIHNEGCVQTTLYCKDEFLDSSLFHDMEITIEEFTSAPKVFNINIKAGPQAIELLSVRIEEFMKLFQERKFGFSIHRIDTELSAAKPLFSRKQQDHEDSGRDKEGNTR